jgi:hypothetical protein
MNYIGVVKGAVPRIKMDVLSNGGLSEARNAEIVTFDERRESFEDLTRLLNAAYRQVDDMGLSYTAVDQGPDVTRSRVTDDRRAGWPKPSTRSWGRSVTTRARGTAANQSGIGETTFATSGSSVYTHRCNGRGSVLCLSTGRKTRRLLMESWSSHATQRIEPITLSPSIRVAASASLGSTRGLTRTTIAYF